MAPKHHPTPLSGGDRKARAKELGRAHTLSAQADEARAKGEALVRTADKLLAESWNELQNRDKELGINSSDVRKAREDLATLRTAARHRSRCSERRNSSPVVPRPDASEE